MRRSLFYTQWFLFRTSTSNLQKLNPNFSAFNGEYMLWLYPWLRTGAKCMLRNFKTKFSVIKGWRGISGPPPSLLFQQLYWAEQDYTKTEESKQSMIGLKITENNYWAQIPAATIRNSRTYINISYTSSDSINTEPSQNRHPLHFLVSVHNKPYQS